MTLRTIVPFGIAIGAALLLPAAAPAQDPVMALSPTTMTGYAGTVAAGQYAARSSARSAGPSAADVAAAHANPQIRSICTNLPSYAARPNATPAKMRRLTGLCRQAGY